MRRMNAIGLGLLMSILIVAATSAAPPPRFIRLPVIGIQTLQLDAEFVKSSASDEMAAFVETGSLQPGCLATLTEANFAGGVGIKMVFCNPRQIERDGRLMNGLAIRLFFDGAVPADVAVTVNAYQEMMVTNPAPIPCEEC